MRNGEHFHFKLNEPGPFSRNQWLKAHGYT